MLDLLIYESARYLTPEGQINVLEEHANREDISIPERLATIHKIYELRGIPKYVYSSVE
jgi:hypothetical protein